MYTPRDCWGNNYFNPDGSVNTKCKLSENDYALMILPGSFLEKEKKVITKKPKRRTNIVQNKILGYNIRIRKAMLNRKIRETFIDRVMQNIERKRSLQSNIG